MERFRGSLAVFVCLSLLSPSAPAWPQTVPSPANQTPNHASARPPYQSGQLRGDERILHALNRFTFGPRPGDLEAVRAMGLERWFNQQLHPETLDQTGLDARLAQFPAMQANPQDLLFRLPSNAVIRQAVDGKAPIPPSGALHSVYENEMARVEFRKQEKDREKQQQASADAAMGSSATMGNGTPMVGAMMSSGAGTMTPEPPQPSQSRAGDQQPGQMSMLPAQSNSEQPPPNEKQIAPSFIAEILSLPSQQRVARLATMEQPEFDSFRKALKPPQRTALTAGLNPAQKELVAAFENPNALSLMNSPGSG